MRTTVAIDDHLLLAAKRRAAEQGTTLGQVIDAALRSALLRSVDVAEPEPFRLVTFRGSGPCSGIDLNRTSELLEFDDLEQFAVKPVR